MASLAASVVLLAAFAVIETRTEHPLLPVRLLAGAPAAVGGMYWLSRISEHDSSYAGRVLGPLLVIAVGLGLLFVPVTMVAMSRAADEESGVAASLRNTGQQVGGSIELAVLGTVDWTVVANSAHVQAARAATAASPGHLGQPSGAALTAVYHHALAAGFSRAFVVTAGIMLLACSSRSSRSR